MKRYPLLRNFLCVLILPLFVAFSISTAGYANVVASGTISPSDPALWTSSTISYIGFYDLETLDDGIGTLSIAGGSSITGFDSYIGYTPDSVGIVTIDGEASSWDNANNLYVGFHGAGELTITDGALVTTDFKGFIGYNAGSTGTVIVAGEGSAWDTDSNLYLGYYGTGFLEIINKGYVVSRSVFIGDNLGAVGTAIVKGEISTWETGGFHVGIEGEGIVSIINGGTVINGGGSTGYTSTGKGTVFVDGEGSTLTSLSSGFDVGRYGDGALIVTNGGTVVINGLHDIGAHTGSNGTVIVDGKDSILNVGGVVVGDEGTGKLTIANGGRVIVENEATISTPNTGAVIVDGIGSIWSISDQLRIGDSGDGSLTIRNGGIVRNSWAILAGVVTVDGEGSMWGNRGYLVVGSNGGKWKLSVIDDGLVTANSLKIEKNSTVSVDVSSSLKVGSDDNGWAGDIENNGIIHLVLGLGSPSGVYTPISFGLLSGNGIIQAIGGVYNAELHTISVSDAAKAQGINGASTVIDLSTNQRGLITDYNTGESIGVSFLSGEAPSNITLAANVAGNTEASLLKGLIADTGEKMLSAWDFSTTDYEVSADKPVYLSLYAYPGKDISSLTIWHFVDGIWTQYDAFDLAFDGTYASFIVDSAGSYAVTGVIDKRASGDFDEDDDVDGIDLFSYISTDTELTMKTVALFFGKG